ncbi:bifunctional transcriptional activator/DNA repair enzyme AdaA [Geomicrobium sediminis]|uniref:AraC family transcriptional regulator of adaptative response / methylphosphotriester-DNA alkyltransferase methyltransferase n=1 Tax=Geomicrobium sediminis TaxID=1347788 RepID=A0ABS2PCJ3_9BACL|nr:Ada metal-binding domain-containing protein [Geomicrobium sediminis]MBM7633159.1 AraC family transcriptional regulator of adaptative response / methylphosphotriester-DNA alkyltransferase methyltransferase [Geomicrobium sediminis]
MEKRVSDEQWQAINTCDQTYDTIFYYGVTSTKIFCRPSCHSRTPQRENIRIFTSIVTAERGGFRPCKRCKPDLSERPESTLINKVTQHLDRHYMNSMTLEQLGEQFHVSPFHLQRTFQKRVGLSPNEYITKRRLEEACQLLTNTDRPVNSIAKTVGMPNAAHFITRFRDYYGLTPKQYREKQR